MKRKISAAPDKGARSEDPPKEQRSPRPSATQISNRLNKIGRSVCNATIRKSFLFSTLIPASRGRNRSYESLPVRCGFNVNPPAVLRIPEDLTFDTIWKLRHFHSSLVPRVSLVSRRAGRDGFHSSAADVRLRSVADVPQIQLRSTRRSTYVGQVCLRVEVNYSEPAEI